MELTTEQISSAIQWYQDNGIRAELDTSAKTVLVLVNGFWLELSSQEVIFRALCNEE